MPSRERDGGWVVTDADTSNYKAEWLAALNPQVPCGGLVTTTYNHIETGRMISFSAAKYVCK